MPHMVEHEVQVRAFRKGDRIMTAKSGKDRVAVLSVDAKRVWAFVTVEGEDKPMKLQSDELWTVLREEQTEEEMAAAQRAYSLKRIKSAIERAPEQVEEAKADLIKHMDDRLSLFDGSFYGEYYRILVATKVRAQLWGQVEHIATHETFEGDELDATLKVAASVRERLFQAAVNGGAHRSSSQMSNLTGDIASCAGADWVDQLRWIGVFDA